MNSTLNKKLSEPNSIMAIAQLKKDIEVIEEGKENIS